MVFTQSVKNVVLRRKKMRNSCCECGTYECAIPMTVPPHLKDRIEHEVVQIDECLAQEINYLWSNDIATIGCCCGHGDRKKAYIQVDENDLQKMQILRYAELPLVWNEQAKEWMGLWCYDPHTLIQYRKESSAIV